MALLSHRRPKLHHTHGSYSLLFSNVLHISVVLTLLVTPQWFPSFDSSQAHIRPSSIGTVHALLGGSSSPLAMYNTAVLQHGTSGNEYYTSAYAFPSGAFYAVGSSFGSLGATNLGSGDIIVGHYFANGTLNRITQFGSSGSDAARDITGNTANEAAVYLVANTNGVIVGSSQGSNDIYVCSLETSTGNRLWEIQTGSTGQDSPYAIAYSSSGLYIVGSTYGSLSGQTHSGGHDNFVMKVSLSGSEIWTVQSPISTSAGDSLYAVTTQSNGNVIAVGRTQGTISGPTNSAGFDAVVIQLASANGAVLQYTQLGYADPFNIEGRGVAVDAQNNVYVAARTDGNVTDHIGSYDILVYKLDSTLSGGAETTPIWIEQYGSVASEILSEQSMKINSAGHLVIAGYTSGDFIGTNQGISDAMLLELDPSNRTQPQRYQFGSSGHDRAYGLAIHPKSGTTIVVGYTTGTLGTAHFGGNDAFAVVVSACPAGSSCVNVSAIQACGELQRNCCPRGTFTRPSQSVCDDIAPVPPTCSNQTRSASLSHVSNGGTVVTYNVTAVDNIDGSVTGVCSPASGALFSAGATPVTCNFTDSASNAASCQFMMMVEDDTAPVIGNATCQNITKGASNTHLADTGTNVTWATPVAVDGVDGSTTGVCSSQSGTLYAIGAKSVTCNFTDAASNLASCSFFIKVEDNIAPVVNNSTCPNVTIFASTAHLTNNGTNVTWATPVAVDGVDGSVTGMCSAKSGNLYPVGATSVTCLFTDTANNVETCAFAVIVQDQSPPFVNSSTCPNITRAASNTHMLDNGTNVTWATPVAVDNVDGAIDGVCSYQSSFRYKLGSTAITCNFTDAASNFARCSFFVNVYDNVAPVVQSNTCPNITAFASTAHLRDSGTNVTWSKPVAIDGADGSIAGVCSQHSGELYSLGSTSVTCTFTDTANNSDMCSFAVTVQDSSAAFVNGSTCPNITSSASRTHRMDGGTNVTWSKPVAVDGVDGSITSVCSSQPGELYPLGSTPISCNFTDSASNIEMCSFVVTVEDTTAPPINSSTCPNVTTAASVSHLTDRGTHVTWSHPFAVDGVDGTVSGVCSSQSGDRYALGTTPMMCNFTDAANNTASCSFSLTIKDETSPLINNRTCVNITSVASSTHLTDSGTNVTWDQPVAMDGVDGPIGGVCSSQSGALYGIGSTTVTCNFTDVAFNSDTCSFQVAVRDSVAPAVDNSTCPNVTTFASTSHLTDSGTNVTWAKPVAVDGVDGPVTGSCSRYSGQLYVLGSTLVTCTFTDSANNSDICSFEVSVQDNNAAFVNSSTCPNITSGASSTHFIDGGTNVTWTKPVAADGVDGSVASMCTSQPGELYPVGSTPVTCNFTDSANNMETCSFVVTVQDVSAPPLNISTCPNVTSSASSTHLSDRGTNVAWNNPAVVDGVDGTIRGACSSQSGDFYTLGATTVRCTFTDSASNAASCEFTVLVQDNSDAFVNSSTCPNVTAFASTSHLSDRGTNVTWTKPVALDGVDGAVAGVCSSHSGELYALGSTSVWCNFTDSAGNADACVFAVIVQDNLAPVVSNTTCPNVTAFASSSHLMDSGTNVTWSKPIAIDGVDGAMTGVCSSHSGELYPLGSSSVTCTFTDIASNSDACSFEVIVQDNIPPVVSNTTCRNITRSASPTHLSDRGTNVTWDNVVAVDGVDGPMTATTCSSNSGEFFPLGSTSVTCTFTDAASNSDTCSFEVTVRDAVPPFVSNTTCPNVTRSASVTHLTDRGTNVTWSALTAVDNIDGSITGVCSRAPARLYPLGATPIECTFTDASNNSNKCSFAVTVEDNMPPVVDNSTCPNVTRSASITHISDRGTIMTWAMPVAIDGVDGLVNSTCSSHPDQLYPVGSTQVTCNFSDASNNSNLCSFVITVADTTAPSVNNSLCPNITQSASDTHLSNSGTNVTWSTPVAADGVDAAVAGVCSAQSGQLYQIGSTSIKCNFTDAAGNLDTCSFAVIVEDTTAPIIDNSTCPNITVFASVSHLGDSGTNVTWSKPVAVDGVDGSIAGVCSRHSGELYSLRSTSVTCTFTDNSSNSDACSFVVLVQDNSAAFVNSSTCPNITSGTSSRHHIDGGTNVTWTKPVAADGVDGSVSSVCSMQPGTLYPVGSTSITCNFTDSANNVETCAFVVTVQDQSAPPVNGSTCPNITRTASSTHLLDSGTNVTWATPVAVDDVDGAIDGVCSVESNTLYELGSTVVTCLFTDTANNVETCAFAVIVQDQSPPFVNSSTCPNITRAASNTHMLDNGTNVTWATPVAVDNVDGAIDGVCSYQSSFRYKLGSTAITCNFTDAASNFARCSFFVNVYDNVAPVVQSNTCPNITAFASTAHLRDSGTNVTWSKPVAIDGADGSIAGVCSQHSGELYSLGSTSVTCTFTDTANNSDMCSFAVTVQDSSAAFVNGSTCPNITSSASRTHRMDGGTNVTWSKPVAVDGVDGSITSVCSSQPGELYPLGSTPISCNFTDSASNIEMCSFVVTVEDTTAPPINSSTCPNVTTAASVSHLTDRGTHVTWSHPFAVDGVDGTVSGVCSSQSGDRYALGTTPMMCNFTDAANNTASCSFSLTIKDETSPLINNRTCVNITSVASSTHLTDSGTNVTWDQPVAMDGVDGPIGGVCSSQSGALYGIGSTTVTCNFTDVAFNSDTCSFQVAVRDSVAPAVDNSTCPNVTTFASTSHLTDSGTNVTWAKPVAVDGVDGPVTGSCSRYSGQLYVLGSTLVTCTFTDSANNSDICSFEVSVQDNNAAFVNSSTCPNITSGASSTHFIDGGTNVTWTKPVAADGVDGSVASMCTSQPGELYPVGSTPVTCNFTDSANNMETCSFVVTVQDVSAPPLNISTCPNVTSSASSTHLSDRGTNVAWNNPAVVDGVDGTIRGACSSQSGDFYTLGATTVRCTFTDSASNAASCEFTVLVQDNSDAFVNSSTCPNVTAFASTSHLSDRGTNVTWTKPVALDGVDGAVAGVCSSHSGELYALGSTSVWCNFTDSAGNADACVFAVIVQDNLAPVVSNTTCPNVTAFASSSHLMDSGTNVTWSKPIAIDGVDGAMTGVCSSHSGELYPLGSSSVTCTFTDIASNSDACSFEVIVQDNIPPVVSNTTCRNITRSASPTHLSDRGTNVTWDNVVAVDGVDGPMTATTCSSNSGEFFPLGSTSVTCTFTDAASNSDTCSFVAVVEDTLAPVVNNATCPNVTAFSSVSHLADGGTNVTWTKPVALDGVDGAVAGVCSSHSGELYALGSTSVTCSFTDIASNANSCSFTVFVRDSEAAVVNSSTCPNITASASSSHLIESGTNVTWATPVAMDGVDGAITGVCSSHSGELYVRGSTSITCTFVDSSANSAQCLFAVIVEDDLAPVLSTNACPSVTQSASSTHRVDSGTNVTWATPVATDGVDGVITGVCSWHSGNFYPLDTTLVTCTFTDASNNSDSCFFTVTIEDNSSPQFGNCTTDVSVMAVLDHSSEAGTVVTWSPPTVSDNVNTLQEMNVTSSYSSGDRMMLGITIVRYNATDVAGNFATCSFIVNVTDQTLPFVNSSTCPPNIRINASASHVADGGTVAIWHSPVVAFDNSHPTPLVGVCNHNPGDAFPVFSTTVACVFTDSSGNSAICSFLVQVDDVTNPTITNCPADIDVLGNLNAEFTPVSWSEPAISDNAATPSDSSLRISQSHTSGTGFPARVTTVMYNTTDASNNEAVCTFNINVTDPYVECPPNVAVDASTTHRADNGTRATWNVPITNVPSVDSLVNTSCNAISNQVFASGENTVNCTFDGVNNFQSSCAFTVTVNDRIPPIFTTACPSDVTLQATAAHAANGGTSVQFTPPLATDNVDALSDGSLQRVLSQSIFDLGITPTFYTITDRNGNNDTCTWLTTVLDVTPPSILNCDQTVTATSSDTHAADGGTLLNRDSISGPVTDNAYRTDQLNISTTAPDPPLFPIGTTAVVVTVSDPSNNLATCTVNIEIIDADYKVVSLVPANRSRADETVDATSITELELYFTEATNLVDNAPVSLCDVSQRQCITWTLPVNASLVQYSEQQRRVHLGIPPNFLRPGTLYSVSFNAGTFQGALNGKPTASYIHLPDNPQDHFGFSSSWVFATSGGAGPAVQSYAPLNNSVVDAASTSSIIVTFDETIAALLSPMAQSQLFDESHNVVVASGFARTAGTYSSITLSSVSLQPSTQYRITIPADSVANVLGQFGPSGNTEYSAVRFRTTGKVNATIAQLKPFNGESLVASRRLQVRYSERVVAGTGYIRVVRLCDGGSTFKFSADRSKSARSDLFSFSNSDGWLTLTLPDDVYIEGCAYDVSVDALAVRTLVGAPGESVGSAWCFSTQGGSAAAIIDRFPEALVPQYESSVLQTTGFNMTFDEAVRIDSSLTFMLVDDSFGISHPFSTSSSVMQVQPQQSIANYNRTVTITSSVAGVLQRGRKYHFEIPSGVVLNSVGQTALLDSFGFVTAGAVAPNLTQLIPSRFNSSISVSLQYVEMRFSENMQVYTSGEASAIVLRDLTAGAQHAILPTDSSAVSFHQFGIVRVQLPYRLQIGRQYQVDVSDTTFSAVSGLPFAGTDAFGVWQFATSLDIPTPQVVSATVGPDALTIDCSFDSTTDQAGYTLGVKFPCSALLSQSTVAMLSDVSSDSRCWWSSSKALSIDLSPRSTIVSGQTLTFLAGKLRTSQQGFVSDVMATATITVELGDTPLAPTVLISAPSSVGTCDSITLDAGQLSYGSGSRPLEFSYSAIDAFSLVSYQRVAVPANLTSFLSAVLPNSTTATVSRELLPADVEITFKVQARNWLSQTGSQQWVSVRRNTQVPTVRMLGGSFVSVPGDSPVTLELEVSCTSCSNAVLECDSVGLQYLWERVDIGDVPAAIRSQAESASVSGFSTPLSSLLPSHMFAKSISIADSDLPAGQVNCFVGYAAFRNLSVAANVQSREQFNFAQGSSAFVCVEVQFLPLVPVVKGGSTRTVGVSFNTSDGSSQSDEVVIDASATYDPSASVGDFDDSGRDVSLTLSYICRKFALNTSDAAHKSEPDVASVIANGVPEECVNMSLSSRDASPSGSAQYAVSSLSSRRVSLQEGSESASSNSGTDIFISDENKLIARRLDAGFVYEIQITASKQGRTSHDTTTLIAQATGPTSAPQVSMSRAKPGALVNVDDKTILNAAILSGETLEDVRIRWTVSGLDMNDQSLFTTAVEDVLELGIAPGALQLQQSLYSVTVSVWHRHDAAAEADVSKQGVSSIDLLINQPPSGGVCVVSPPAGAPLETKFTIACSGWSGTNAPFEYRFALTTPGSSQFVIKKYGTTSSVNNVLLPLVPTSTEFDNNSTHTVSVLIRDGNGGVTTATVPVLMNVESAASAITNSSAAADFIAAELGPTLTKSLDEGDSQAILATVALATSLLEATSTETGVSANGTESDDADTATAAQRAEVRDSLVNVLEQSFTQDAGKADAVSVDQVSANLAIVASVSTTKNAAELSPTSLSSVQGMVSNQFDLLVQAVDKGSKTVASSVSEAGSVVEVVLSVETPSACPIAAVDAGLRATANILRSTTAAVDNLAAANSSSSSSSDISAAGPGAVAPRLSRFARLIGDGRNGVSSKMTLPELQQQITDTSEQFTRNTLLAARLIGCNALDGEAPAEGGNEDVFVQSAKRVGSSSSGQQFQQSKGSASGTSISMPKSLQIGGQPVADDASLFISFAIATENPFAALGDVATRGIGEGVGDTDALSSSGASTVSFIVSATSNDQESSLESTVIDVHNLAEPLLINITHDTLPLEPASATEFPPQSLCRFWNVTLAQWDTSGCVRVGTFVHPTQPGKSITTCSCDHATEFSAAAYAPSIQTISAQDILNLSWENLKEHPTALICIAGLLGVYLTLLPIALCIDRRNASDKKAQKPAWGMPLREHVELHEYSINASPEPSYCETGQDESKLQEIASQYSIAEPDMPFADFEPNAIAEGVALYNFAATRPEHEVDLVKCELVSVFSSSDSGWSRVKTSVGTIGWVPTNYLQMMSIGSIVDERSTHDVVLESKLSEVSEQDQGDGSSRGIEMSPMSMDVQHSESDSDHKHTDNVMTTVATSADIESDTQSAMPAPVWAAESDGKSDSDSEPSPVNAHGVTMTVTAAASESAAATAAESSFGSDDDSSTHGRNNVSNAPAIFAAANGHTLQTSVSVSQTTSNNMPVAQKKKRRESTGSHKRVELNDFVDAYSRIGKGRSVRTEVVSSTVVVNRREFDSRRRVVVVKSTIEEKRGWFVRVLWPMMKASHLWLAIFKRHPRDPVSSVERLSVLFGAILGAFFVSALFYGTQPSSGAEVVVALLSALMMIPATVLLLALFRGTCHPGVGMGKSLEELAANDDSARKCTCHRRGKRFAWTIWAIWCLGAVFLTLVYGLRFSLEQSELDVSNTTQSISSDGTITIQEEEGEPLGLFGISLSFLGVMDVAQKWMFSVVVSAILDVFANRPLLIVIKALLITLLESLGDRHGNVASAVKCALMCCMDGV
jgi:large repetitive protein